MTEWWLRKAVICHLSPIFCNYYFIRDGIPTSPLTRSVGSVTSPYFSPFVYLFIFQLTRSVGSVTTNRPMTSRAMQISTHTLRGERDIFKTFTDCSIRVFQLTRSVGSVTSSRFAANKLICISTHTLRGERDFFRDYLCMTVFHFNSHAPWGA